MSDALSRVRSWVDSGKHLPSFLRDFHDQKDVFKLIANVFPYGKEDRDPCNWIQAQIYVIDRFLRFMALHGYTLQKTRKRGEFYGLADGIKEMKDKQLASFVGLIERAAG